MEAHDKDRDSHPAARQPWNKSKLIGQKLPLRPKHVWAIRTKLHVKVQVRDFAMIKLAIDSKLRGCDVVAIRVEDVAPTGYALERATVRQKKTGAWRVRAHRTNTSGGRRLHP